MGLNVSQLCVKHQEEKGNASQKWCSILRAPLQQADEGLIDKFAPCPFTLTASEFGTSHFFWEQVEIDKN